MAVLNLISLLCSWPIVVLGTLLLLVGAYWNKQGLLAVYLFAMALLIAALLFVTVFAFVATTNKSGCCKLPTACGYKYMNPTLWLNPANPSAEPDCYIWSNNQGRLCYDCISCKAGLLGNLREEWRKANTIVIAAVVIFISVYLIACSAFRNV